MKNKQTLFVTDHNPSTTGGGAYATRAFINAFGQIVDGELVVLGASCINKRIFETNKTINLVKIKPRSTYQKIFGLFSLQLHRFRKAFKEYIRQNHSFIQYIIFDGSIVAGDLINIAQKYKIPALTIHHNVDGKYFKDSRSFYTLWGLTSALIDYRQKNAFKKSKINFTLSEKDKIDLSNRFGNAVRDYCQNIGCFEYEKKDYTPPNTKQINKYSNLTLVISGSLSSYQTEDGVLWFIKELLPSLSAYSNLSIIISGKNPSEKVVKLIRKDKRIKLIPNPLNMDNIIQMADIYICPTRLGSGIKLRVMDGLKNGKPVLTQFISSSGYEAHNEKPWFYTFENKLDFSTQFKLIYENLQKYSFSSDEIVLCYQRDFSFDSGVKRIKNILNTHMNI